LKGEVGVGLGEAYAFPGVEKDKDGSVVEDRIDPFSACFLQ